MVPVTNTHEAILQANAQRALHLTSALLAPELESFVIRLRHGGTLIRLIKPASTDSSLSFTFRLADSLLRELLDHWHRAREAFLAANPPPWDDITEACYHGPFSDKLDESVSVASYPIYAFTLTSLAVFARGRRFLGSGRRNLNL